MFKRMIENATVFTLMLAGVGFCWAMFGLLAAILDWWLTGHGGYGSGRWVSGASYG